MKSFICLCVFFMVIGCKKTLDYPAIFADPLLQVTTSIRSLCQTHVKAGSFDTIQIDDVISGIVIANDKEGNFYQTIIIQDTTGGIAIKIDGYGLSALYPIGRRLFVKVKGLILSDYARCLQIGAGVDNQDTNQLQLLPILSTIADKYIYRGSMNHIVTPKVVSPSALTTQMSDPCQNTLIQINACQIRDQDISKLFGDPTLAQSGISYKLALCNGESITLRNSSYSSFASYPLPKLNGYIVGVYTLYNSAKQIIIRDTTDMHFNQPRCGDDRTITPEKPYKTYSFADIKKNWKGVPLLLDHIALAGVVISDSSNIDNTNQMIVQNGTEGIIFSFPSSISYSVGDSIRVECDEKDFLAQEKGSWKINFSSPSPHIQLVSRNNIVKPISIPSIQMLTQHADLYQSILVTLPELLIEDTSYSSLLGGIHIIKDMMGSCLFHIDNKAPFAIQPFSIQPIQCTGYYTLCKDEWHFHIRTEKDMIEVPQANEDYVLMNISPLQIDLSHISNDLPKGIAIRQGSTTVDLGNIVPWNGGVASWSSKTSGVKNVASSFSLHRDATAKQQEQSNDRAIAIKQATTGFTDPGASFVWQIPSTYKQSHLVLSFMLESLDTVATRETVWQIDYSIGNLHQLFVPFSTQTWSTGNKLFFATPITVDFQHILDHWNMPIWIRLTALSPSKGSGTRATTAISHIQLSWNDR